ncbi:Soluble guanylate cyclase gcy-35 [Durusdinium trenchii]|uniref:Soluble guanylate cyclase gcy-35 n=1 Tax=Durusdinium trenchii TaxID=1381693 RepID=A0ABP0J0U7_9DINO
MVRLILALVLCTSVLAQKRPPRREAQKEFAECLLTGSTNEECRSLLEGNRTRDEVRERLEKEKGVPLVLGELLKNCTMEMNTTGSNKTFQDCRKEVMDALKLLRGKDVTPEEFEAELRKVAAERVRELIEACLESASTDAAKEACFNSDEAKREAALLTGKDPSEFKVDDLREAVREGAARDIADAVEECRAKAANEDAKKECMKSDDFKKQIGNSRGKGSGDVKDSEVREFIEKGVLEDIWSLMENCEADKQAECLDTAKGLLADALGKSKEEISDSMLRKKLDEAMGKALGTKMRACMEAAEDDAAKDQCKDILVQDALGTRNGTQARGARTQALAKAGRSAALEVIQDCTGSREACMEILKEKAAESMGRSKDDLSNMELERLNLEGAKDAAKNAAKSCRAAKDADASATCQDVIEVFKQGRGKDMDETESRRVKGELAKDMDKEDMKLCFDEESSKEAFESCLEMLDSSDKVKDDLFSELSEGRKNAKKKRAKDEAAVEAVGEIFKACMEEATSDTEKAECRSAMKEKSEMAGLEEDVEDVLKKYQRNVVATAARVCSSAERAQCVKAAKDELVKMGLKKRAFGLVKKLADLKAAAETYAACQETSATENTTCIELAKSTLEELSGSTDIWSDEIESKVKELGEAYLEGREVFIRKLKELAFEAVTDLLNCSEAFLDRIMDRIQNISDGFNGRNSSGPRNISDKLCRVTWGFARMVCKIHSPDLDDDEMMNLSDTIAEEVSTAELSGSRRLEERRLATVTETYVDQEQEETATSSSTSMGGESGSSTSDESGESSTTQGSLPISNSFRAAFTVTTGFLSALFF